MAPTRSARTDLRSAATRITRHAKPRKSYREETSASEDSSDDSSENDSDEPDYSTVGASRTHARPQKQPRRHSARSQQPTRKRSLDEIIASDPDEILYESRPKRRSPTKRDPARTTTGPKTNGHSIQIPPGRIPPWNTLPYHILVQIFEHAAYPLYDDKSFQSTPNVSWLLKAARLARPFREPALTVLYRSPPLVPMQSAHALARRLKPGQRGMLYNYAAKVERLQIEVSQTAAYKLSGHGLLDLSTLIKPAIRLKDLELYHLDDMPPYRDLEHNIRWKYPQELFDALAEVWDEEDITQTGEIHITKRGPIALRSWRWNSRMVGKNYQLHELKALHSTPSFKHLQKIAFVNYQEIEYEDEDHDPQLEKHLVESLDPLTDLRHLIFESSTLLNSKLMPLLPSNLYRLELINCWEITAEDLATYLVTKGYHLRELVIQHCQSLNLSFLPILGSACPNLTLLSMNFNYFSVHDTYHDSEPEFSKLLEVGQVPTWPSKLQTLEFLQLRNWDVDTANMFFQSIVDSAESLPDLRKFVVKAILKTGWRDRATFRDKWVDTFTKVFLREPTVPHRWTSLRDFEVEKRQIPEPKKENTEVIVDNGRHKRRKFITTIQSEAPSSPPEHRIRGRFTVEDDSDGDPSDAEQPSTSTKEESSKPSLRRSSRRISKEITYTESDSSPEPEEPIQASKASKSSKGEEDSSPPRGPRKSGLHHEIAWLGSTAADMDRASQRHRNAARRIAAESAALRENALSFLPDTPGATTESESEGKKSVGEKGEMEEEKEKPLFIQGMCQTVDIRIDNLRPTENQFAEEDFLDSEPDGDDDYDGVGDVGGDDGYAW